MVYSRRQLLGAGAAAGLVATAAKAESLAELVGLKPTPAPLALPGPTAASAAAVPAAPKVIVDPVIDARLLARARAAFDRHRSALRNTDVVGITDFARGSGLQRFFLLDTQTGKVSKHFVSHGRGSDPAHSGFLTRFSNAYGSNATSDGGYLTSEYYYGKYGRSMRLDGLDPSNSNARGRAIVVHSAWYAEPEVIDTHGKLGRSEGCFAFSNTSLQEVLARLGPGRFLYADKVA